MDLLIFEYDELMELLDFLEFGFEFGLVGLVFKLLLELDFFDETLLLLRFGWELVEFGNLLVDWILFESELGLKEVDFSDVILG